MAIDHTIKDIDDMAETIAMAMVEDGSLIFFKGFSKKYSCSIGNSCIFDLNNTIYNINITQSIICIIP